MRNTFGKFLFVFLDTATLESFPFSSPVPHSQHTHVVDYLNKKIFLLHFFYSFLKIHKSSHLLEFILFRCARLCVSESRMAIKKFFHKSENSNILSYFLLLVIHTRLFYLFIKSWKNKRKLFLSSLIVLASGTIFGRYRYRS